MTSRTPYVENKLLLTPSVLYSICLNTKSVLWHQEATPRGEMPGHGMKTTSRYATGLNPGKMNKPVHGHPDIGQLFLQFIGQNSDSVRSRVKYFGYLQLPTKYINKTATEEAYFGLTYNYIVSFLWSHFNSLKWYWELQLMNDGLHVLKERNIYLKN
jgi:hypothetical protein